jgi:hypothetical protein
MGNWTKQNCLKRTDSYGQKTHKKCSPSLAIKEMQIKTILRFHLTSVRIAIIKNTINSTCWWECGEKGILVHCWWECKLVQPLWKKIWRLFQNLNTDPPYDPAIPLLGYTQSNVTQVTPEAPAHPRYWRAIHNSQVMETTRTPHYWWMDQESVVIVHSGILLSHEED